MHTCTHIRLSVVGRDQAAVPAGSEGNTDTMPPPKTHIHTHRRLSIIGRDQAAVLAVGEEIRNAIRIVEITSWFPRIIGVTFSVFGFTHLLVDMCEIDDTRMRVCV